MQDTPSRGETRLTRFLADPVAAGFDVATVVSARLAMLASPDVAPAEKMQETIVMVAEKLIAVANGALSSHAASAALLVDPASTILAAPLDVAARIGAILDAGAAPALARLDENARRFRRGASTVADRPS